MILKMEFSPGDNTEENARVEREQKVKNVNLPLIVFSDRKLVLSTAKKSSISGENTNSVADDTEETEKVKAAL